MTRRSAFRAGGASAAAALLAFPVNIQPAAAAEQPLPLPPAAVVLQVAETTATLEGMMRQSVKDMDDLTDQQRKDVGRWPPIGRAELKGSVDVLLRNSKLATLPKGDEAAGVLGGVKLIVGSGNSPLSKEEYLIVASQYSKARDACRAVFESFTAAQQAEAKEIVRKLQTETKERIRQNQEEEEKVRLLRAKIAEEKKAAEEAAGGGVAEPPRKKTLKELEEANAKAFGKQAPTMSLYGR